MNDTPVPTEAAPADVDRPRRTRRWTALGGGLAAVLFGATACVSAAGVANQTLTIAGSSLGETIVLRLRAGDPNVVEVDDGDDGDADFAFDRQTFTAIEVDGGGGNDTLRIDRSNGVFTDTEATTLSGGDGNDTLIGDIGAERLDGGAGDDTIDGNQGNDVIIGGDGADTLRWVPGDGSDTFEGGAGTDHLAFSGANVNEQFDVSANGPRVRFFRNVANITMDLEGVEAIDLPMLGGTDVLNVHDVTGTGLQTINADLAAIGGVDDGQLDEVVVPLGAAIGQDGDTATVGGLGAQVRVRNGTGNDRIHLTGPTAADTISLAGTGGPDAVSAAADGTDVAVFGVTPGVHVELTSVERIDLDLGTGDDSFSAVGNLAALTSLDVDGGPGADTLLGGNGADLLQGGTGDDHLDGNQGNDTIIAGDGNDTIQWDPGDGSDTIEGGRDTDHLAFNGANVNEQFDVSANGPRVRFFRNVANITLDVDDVEAFDVNLLGGTDGFVVNDLTGTDLKSVNVNLAALGGGDDGAADSIVVNGTPGNDTVTVQDTGPTVNVLGLAAQVNISGSTAALDRLTVNGLAGTDTLSAAPGVNGLIQLSFVP